MSIILKAKIVENGIHSRRGYAKKCKKKCWEAGFIISYYNARTYCIVTEPLLLCKLSALIKAINIIFGATLALRITSGALLVCCEDKLDEIVIVKSLVITQFKDRQSCRLHKWKIYILCTILINTRTSLSRRNPRRFANRSLDFLLNDNLTN